MPLPEDGRHRPPASRIATLERFESPTGAMPSSSNELVRELLATTAIGAFDVGSRYLP
jgi:hypothetical protein